MLGLDLFVINRNPHVVQAREALAWTVGCVVLALVFPGAVYLIYANNWLGIGTEFLKNHAPESMPEAGAAFVFNHHVGFTAALEFLTGWIIEYSLSLDN